MENCINDKLLKKVRDLLARADENRNDNKHERDIALRQAETLMAKHAISHVDLSQSQQRRIIGDLTDTEITRTSRDLWPVFVMSSLSKLYRCRVIKLNGNRLHIFGHQTNIDILKSMTEYCVKSIRREMQIALENQSGFKVNCRRFNTSFGNGAANGIAEQVRQLIEQRDRGNIPEMDKSTAMIIIDEYRHQRLEVKKLLNDVYPRLGRSAGSKSTSAQGHHAGRQFGESIHLGGQLGGKPPTRQLG